MRKISKTNTEKPFVNAFVTFKSPSSVKKLLEIQAEKDY